MFLQSLEVTTMSLFSMALRNVKKNFYNYFLYFASMIFSIMIYYTFTSIQYNEQVLMATGASFKIDTALKSSSFVIALFSAIFIWYSNSFFTRRRKKEIGLYSLMGVKKKQIGRMLFYENTAIGVLALGAGILIGSLLSKLFAMLLVRLMGFDAVVNFVLIPKAIINTLVVFAILFFITSIHGYTIIYRFKLVELFRAEKTSEKEPKASLVSAIFAALLIGGGYWWYLNGLTIMNNFLLLIFGTLFSVVTGTYLLFSSLIIFVLKIAKRNRKRYFKGVNMIGTSQLLYRIKSNSKTLATIAVLSASTLTALSVVASMYYDTTTKMDKNYPFSYVYINKDVELDKKIEDAISKYPNNKLTNKIELLAVKAMGTYPKVHSTNIPQEGTIYLVSESKYNEVMKAKKMSEIKLTGKDECYVVDEWYIKGLDNGDGYAGKLMNTKIGDVENQLKVVGFTQNPLFNERMLPQFIVVKDEIYDSAAALGKYYRIMLYNTENRKDSKAQASEVKKILDEADLDERPSAFCYTSYYDEYARNLSGSGLTTFIGAFLGLVFLTATGSIIFFKQLSEANDDKERYRILKNIGVSKKEVRASIGRQILFIFLLPLMVGATHSIVAVSLLNKLLGIELYIPVGGTIGLYSIIYFVYYLITVKSYNKLI